MCARCLAAAGRRAPGPHLPEVLARLGVRATCSTRSCSSARIGLGVGGLVEAGQRRRSTASRTSRSSRPGSWPRARCRAPRASRCGRSWPGPSGSGPSTRWSPRRSARATCTSASWPGPACAPRSARTVFLVVAALLGGVLSWWAPLAIPAAVLTALAFAAPLSRVRPRPRTPTSGSPSSCGSAIVPLFLFSGTFFPVEPAARLAAAVLLALAALARRRALPRRHHRLDRRARSRRQRRRPRSRSSFAGALWGIRTFTRKLAT